MKMMSRLAPLVLFLAATAGPVTVASLPRDPASLVVHEWGTFTSVAGEDGSPIDWWTLGGVQDLPCFVDLFRQFPKSTLGGTVRMETPVIYFYSPRAATVDVAVQFRQGMITEWFPRATVSPNALNAAGQFARPGFVHGLNWSNVRLAPGAPEDYPREAAPSHYYAARETDATPIQVGTQREKFLFYRGVAGFPVPIAATAAADGKVTIRNTGVDPLPAVILFESRGGKIGYRIQRKVTREVALDRPVLNAEFRTLAEQLERMLIEQGLYAKEARAMVETWRDSWFEEGTRVFYLVPARKVDEVLPLTVDPKPNEVARVFVGRVELLTAVTLQEVAKAIGENNPAAAVKYGRFLNSIVARLFPEGSHRAQRDQANRVLQPAYASLGNGSCAASASTITPRH
jgi:hypothetical protein